MSSADLAAAYAGPAPKGLKKADPKSQADDRIARRAAAARRASVSVRTNTGGGYSQPVESAKNSLRDEIRAAMER